MGSKRFFSGTAANGEARSGRVLKTQDCSQGAWLWRSSARENIAV